MAAESIGIFTVDFPDPYALNHAKPKPATLRVRSRCRLRRRSSQITVNPLQSNISFQLPITTNIQTLSTKNVERGNDPFGLLYVPDLRSDDCKKSEQDFMSDNVTRQNDLPRGTEYTLIAVAPWFSPTCMDEYFQSARSSPVKAFIVYQPGKSIDMPPPMNDPSWGLGDGGSWKSANTFPTYAIIPMGGSIIMEQLGKYSGNLSEVPYGEELADLFDPADYVRLWATVNTQPGSQLPSLWVFLVIVLGILILVLGATSTSMHIIQRRRRNSLRRRVINGEIDLEALGVKRLTVPQQYLDKLPLYTIPASRRDAIDHEKLTSIPVPAQGQAHNMRSPTVETETRLSSTPLARHPSAPSASRPPKNSAFSQPTCAICLDDFEPGKTQVRELLCRHIFHPNCIDSFLLSNSSLCPMCKMSVLPTGYCPATITNVMVRRERMISRMRRNVAERHTAQERPPATPHHPGPGISPRAPGSLGRRMGGAIMDRRVFTAPERAQHGVSDIEMGAHVSNTPITTPLPDDSPDVPIQTSHAPPERCADSPAQNRREWARQRALALLGNRHALADAANEEENHSMPRWKEGLRKIFPGFR